MNFFAAVSKTLAVAAVQCMPSPRYTQRTWSTRRTRETVLPVYRGSAGKGLEPRGIRFELPTLRTHPATDQRVRLLCFMPYTPDERIELYRRVYGA